MIEVYSLATGAERDWTWPGEGWVGSGSPLAGFTTGPLSWTADGSRLLFRVNTGHGVLHRSAQIRLLATTRPGGDLRAASQRLPVPANELGPYGRPAPVTITGTLIITGDGTRAVATTSRAPKRRPGHPRHPAPMLEGSIIGFPVHAGQPVRVFGRQELSYDTGARLYWVNQTGSALIVYRPAARYAPGLDGTVGVLTPDGFTPFPAGVQRSLSLRQPVW
jgi:hypothetical protein